MEIQVDVKAVFPAQIDSAINFLQHAFFDPEDIIRVKFPRRFPVGVHPQPIIHGYADEIEAPIPDPATVVFADHAITSLASIKRLEEVEQVKADVYNSQSVSAETSNGQEQPYQAENVNQPEIASESNEGSTPQDAGTQDETNPLREAEENAREETPVDPEIIAEEETGDGLENIADSEEASTPSETIQPEEERPLSAVELYEAGKKAYRQKLYCTALENFRDCIVL